MADRRAFINQIGSALTELVNRVTRASAKRVAGSASSDSVAASEQDKVAHSQKQFQSTLTVRTTCLELLEAGGEHAQALVKTIGPDSLILASATCVRSALEPCSLVRWILDPKTSEYERISRVFAFRYAGQVQRLRFARSASLIVDEQGAEFKMNEIINDALGRGYRILKNKRGKRIGIHEYIPSATKVINDYLHDEDQYRLLSAVAHGHEWAIRSLAFQQQSSKPDVLIDGIPAFSHRKNNSDPHVIAMLGGTMANAFSMAALAYGGYVGWGKQDLDSIRKAERRLHLVANTLYKRVGGN